MQPRQPRASTFVSQPRTMAKSPDDCMVRELEFSPNFNPDKFEDDLRQLEDKIESRKYI
jgi:hypothetical protein